ncbi:type III-B CRISPR module RAMP protein Cmr1 [Saccharibacillus sacchari]|uniref:Type III-B CRISPR module RAMP protein Cmr1 n=1 Tax=Saccharibacillus sacchari TaxID=456493 RepID=A0ACC6PC13_9BACL
MRWLDNPTVDFSSYQLENLPYSSYNVKTVTPMFGGGSEAGRIDKNRPVHVSSIKGQLRFWWRATRGATFATTYELRKREIEIFGDTQQPSSMKIWIEHIRNNEIQSYAPQRYDNHAPYPPYLFQKVNDGARGSKPVHYILQCEFRLCMQWSQKVILLKESNPEEFKKWQLDWEAAVWAWINFGGIGARTRRGGGSLYCHNVSPGSDVNSSQNFMNWLNERMKHFELNDLKTTDTLKEWPTLSGKVIVKDQIDDNWRMENCLLGRENEPGTRLRGSWYESIECYRRFRHKVLRGNKRSLWPEPDSVREITGMKEIAHETPHPSTKPSKLVSFPRAQLGLPIIFKFRQNKVLDNSYTDKREPYTTQLLPKGKTRLASPLILKTIAIQENKGFAAIIVLNQPVLKELELDLVPIDEKRLNNDEKKHIREVEKRLKAQQLQKDEIYPRSLYSDSPMSRKNKNYNSTVKAFLNSEEVERFCKTQIRNSNNQNRYSKNRKP